jgi:hypothetical protein
MKVKISLMNFWFLFVLLIFAALSITAESPKQKNPSNPSEAASAQKLSMLNPAATNAMVPRLPLAPRLSSLEGKTIYMVDIGWGGPEAGYDVLQVLSKRLAQNIPDIKTVVLRKKGSYMMDDPDLWKEIKAKGHAAILGLSC